MRIGLLGATGGSGRAFLSLASEAGHDVRVVARRPDAVPVEPARPVEVTAGDATDPEALGRGLAGCDVVVNLVGVSGLLAARRGTTVYSGSAAALVAAAPVAGYSRVVMVTSGGVVDQPGDGWFYTHVLKRHFLEPTYRDMRAGEQVLRGSSLAWTLVRPGYLTGDDQRTDYRVSVDRPVDEDGSLSRWSLAHAILHRALADDAAGHSLAVAT
ncbi:NAD(P)-dependent oxidoreductase [Nocardioides kribbensis]|uniref:NAD(P)-dependent oxidoreductase n=1 Tax=Nocardioides kribbensis TaxID=305517 RepID=UPI0032DAFDD6